MVASAPPPAAPVAPAAAGAVAGPGVAPVRIDTDSDGYRYRSGEIVAVDMDPAALDRLRELGYSVISSERLEGAGLTLQVLRGPIIRDVDALRRAAPTSTLGLNHVFDPSGVTSTGVEAAAAPHAGRACACRIGMIDTGVDARLASAHGARLVQRAFGGGAPRPQPHGGAVAALILAEVSQGPREAADTTLFVADVFAPGPEAGTAAAMASALSWLSASGVPVINISMSGPPNPVIAKVIEGVSHRGVVVVAAAGNDGPAAPPVFPGAYPQVVAVTAVDGQHRPYRYANRGAYVMFAAEGVDVRVPGVDGVGQTVSGTSFAAPRVAVEMARRLPEPALPAAQKALQAVTSAAIDLGAPGRDPVFGYGLVGGPP